jgi:hypothetical protein
MINQYSQNDTMRARNATTCYTIGMCIALLAWCPPARAQANNPAPASAEEVKQLREVVQSLLARVTELEKELKRQQPAATASTERNSTDSNATHAETGATAGASPITAPAQTATVEASKDQAITAIAGFWTTCTGQR